MIVLVEGVDKTGKDTLIKDLSEVFNARVFKNSYKPAGNEELAIGYIAGIYNGIYQFLKDEKEIVILNRSHITEIVYSFKRDYESLEHIDWIEVEKELLKDACIIYMTAPDDVICERFKTDKEDHTLPEEISRLKFRYSLHLALTKIPFKVLSSIEDREKNLAAAMGFIISQKWTSAKSNNKK